MPPTICHRRPAQRRQVDAVQPADRQARRAGLGHAGPDARPARGRGRARPATPVTLVDTAGLEEAAPGSIAARMRAAERGGDRRADLVLFVLDARDGVTSADEAFARAGRASPGVPVILVANKCEGRAGDEGFYEAFQLGLRRADRHLGRARRGPRRPRAPTMLAALGLKPNARQRTGRRTSPRMRRQPRRSHRRPIRVAIVGRPNAGKSTLVNALLGEERMITGPEPGLTRDAVATDFVWEGRPIRLFDTAGLRRKARITRDGREARRQRRRARHPLRRGGGAADRRRASASSTRTSRSATWWPRKGARW